MLFYAIIYTDGFALGEGDVVRCILPCVRGAEITPCGSLEEAYVYACRTYVKRALSRDSLSQPILPRLDQIQQGQMFRTAGRMPAYYENEPYYAAVSIDACAILTIKNVEEFLQIYPWSVIRQCSSTADAEVFIRRKYFEKIYPMSAYYQNPIPFMAERLPIDRIVPVIYKSWLKTQREMLPVKLPFPMVSDKTKEVGRWSI